MNVNEVAGAMLAEDDAVTAGEAVMTQALDDVGTPATTFALSP